MKFFHLSDLHIGQSNNDQKVGEITRWIIDHASQHEARLVLITGDVVDSGFEWQYQKAQQHVEHLRQEGFRVLVVPGNHDYGPLGIAESRRSAEHFKQYLAGGRDFPSLEVIDREAFLLLDSMQQELQDVEIWGAEGELGDSQLGEVKGMLDDLEGYAAVDHVIVALHHHPFEYKNFHELRDAQKLMEVVSRSETSTRRVHCLLFGHKHVAMRFDHPAVDMESRYGLDLIFAAGSTVERDRSGRMTLPVINLKQMSIQRWKVQ